MTRRKTPTPIQKVQIGAAASTLIRLILGVVPPHSESTRGSLRINPWLTPNHGVRLLERVGPRRAEPLADRAGLLDEDPHDLVVRLPQLVQVASAGGERLEDRSLLVGQLVAPPLHAHGRQGRVGL